MKNRIEDPVIVLAAGAGTRLRSVVSDVPKPMAPMNGKPFLAYIFDHLAAQGVSHVICTIWYKKEVIRDYFGDSYGSMRITYSDDGGLLGTGGSIKHAFDHVTDHAFVLNGDTFFDIDLVELKKTFIAAASDVAIALKHLDSKFDRYGSVKLDPHDRIVAFHEKRPMAQGIVNGGVYYLDKKLFGRIDTPEQFSFESDVLEKYVDQLTISGKVFDGYFIDIGIPESYEQAQREIA